jgi:O-antigen/teichoic acid export membrane protein
MATITILSILLTQVDKLMLSKLLPLTNFAYYTLGSTMAGALSLLIAPINNAIYPRIIEFVSLGEINTLADAYHKFSQMLTLIVAPAGIVMSLFSTHILLLWTRDVNTTVHVAPLVSILAIGTMLNGLMHTPYTLQLAYGWTRFMVVVNIVSVLIIVPLIYIEVQIYGAIAAAFLWVFLNASYLLIAVPMMHRKLLPSELRHWFITDTLAPASAGLLAAGFVRLLSSNPTLNKPLENIFELSLAAAAATSAAALATPIGRDLLRQYIRPIFVKTISL